MWILRERREPSNCEYASRRCRSKTLFYWVNFSAIKVEIFINRLILMWSFREVWSSDNSFIISRGILVQSDDTFCAKGSHIGMKIYAVQRPRRRREVVCRCVVDERRAGERVLNLRERAAWQRCAPWKGAGWRRGFVRADGGLLVCDRRRGSCSCFRLTSSVVYDSVTKKKCCFISVLKDWKKKENSD